MKKGYFIYGDTKCFAATRQDARNPTPRRQRESSYKAAAMQDCALELLISIWSVSHRFKKKWLEDVRHSFLELTDLQVPLKP